MKHLNKDLDGDLKEDPNDASEDVMKDDSNVDVKKEDSGALKKQSVGLNKWKEFFIIL